MKIDFTLPKEEIVEMLKKQFEALDSGSDEYFAYMHRENQCALISIELALSVCPETIATQNGGYYNHEYLKLQVCREYLITKINN